MSVASALSTASSGTPAAKKVLRRWAAPVFCFLVAGGATFALAVRMAPTGDEFHTLSHLDHGGIDALWDSYRALRDTLPPAGYVVSWALAGLTGDGIVGVRMPMVPSWALGAAVLAVACRRSGPSGSIAGALLPSASTMVFCGAFARPYATVFAAVAVAVLAWQCR